MRKLLLSVLFESFLQKMLHEGASLFSSSELFYFLEESAIYGDADVVFQTLPLYRFCIEPLLGSKYAGYFFKRSMIACSFPFSFGQTLSAVRNFFSQLGHFQRLMKTLTSPALALGVQSHVLMRSALVIRVPQSRHFASGFMLYLRESFMPETDLAFTLIIEAFLSKGSRKKRDF
jgi:hypothetical protein